MDIGAVELVEMMGECVFAGNLKRVVFNQSHLEDTLFYAPARG